jgi:hypothetical protein
MAASRTLQGTGKCSETKPGHDQRKPPRFWQVDKRSSRKAQEPSAAEQHSLHMHRHGMRQFYARHPHNAPQTKPRTTRLASISRKSGDTSSRFPLGIETHVQS